MKSAAFVFIWTIIFIVFGIFTNNNIENFTNKYTDKLQTIEELVEVDNWDNANKNLDKFLNSWYKEKEIWYKLLDHTYFDDISLYASILDKSISIHDKSKCFEQIEIIKTTLDNIVESVKFDLNHIL